MSSANGTCEVKLNPKATEQGRAFFVELPRALSNTRTVVPTLFCFVRIFRHAAVLLLPLAREAIIVRKKEIQKSR